MAAANWESSSGGASDGECYELDVNDEEEDQSLSGSITKLQFRKCASTARWNDQKGMAEVLENKGRLWTTTGMVRSGKIYCSIEETLYLTEVGALHTLDQSDRSLSLRDLYMKVAQRKGGCSWDHLEVYRYLKSLGYIVGRQGVPWSVKNVKNYSESASSQCSDKSNGRLDEDSEEDRSIIRMLNYMQINDVGPAFDVYPPNSKFRKSSPGDPSFIVFLTRWDPPSKAEIELLERRFGGIPLKFCHVENGRVSFFSFDKTPLCKMIQADIACRRRIPLGSHSFSARPLIDR